MSSQVEEQPFEFEKETIAFLRLQKVLKGFHRYYIACLSGINAQKLIDQLRDRWQDFHPITARELKGIIICCVSWPGFVNVDPKDKRLLQLVPSKLVRAIMRALGKFREIRYDKKKNTLFVV